MSRRKFINNNLINPLPKRNNLIRMLTGSLEEIRRFEEEREIYYCLKKDYGKKGHCEEDNNQLGLIASIIAAWKEMNTQQKIIAVIAVLLISGVTFAVAYNLLPYMMTLFNQARANYDCHLSRRSLTQHKVLSRHEINYLEDSSISIGSQAKFNPPHSKQLNFPLSNPIDITKKIVVGVDNDLYKYVDKLTLTDPQQSSTLKTKILNKLSQINKLIPQLSFTHDALNRLIKSGLEIIVMDTDEFTKMTSQDYGSIGIRGVYWCEEHIIIVPLDSRERELRNVLQNELFHALTKVANLKKVNRPDVQCKTQALSYPFLDKQGNIDPFATDKLHKAIDEYSKNCQLFASLNSLGGDHSSLSSTHQIFYEKLKKAIIKSYQPKMHFITLEEDVYAVLEEGIKKGKLKKAKNSPFFLLTREFLSEVRLSYSYWIDPTNIIETTAGEFILQGYLAGNGSTEAKVEIFIEDTKITFRDYSLEFKNDEATVSMEDSIYQSLSNHKRLSELSSEIQTHSNEIKEILCPLWCNYISEYMEIDNYCSVSTGNVRPT